VNNYENVVIFNAELSDEDFGANVRKISELITGMQGEILKTDHWGRRRLAYAINKNAKGNYVMFLFRAPSNVIKKLEEYYKVNDQIIKFMVVKLEKKQTEGTLKALEAVIKAKAAAVAAASAPQAPAATEQAAPAPAEAPQAPEAQ